MLIDMAHMVQGKNYVFAHPSYPDWCGLVVRNPGPHSTVQIVSAPDTVPDPEYRKPGVRLSFNVNAFWKLASNQSGYGNWVKEIERKESCEN